VDRCIVGMERVYCREPWLTVRSDQRLRVTLYDRGRLGPAESTVGLRVGVVSQGALGGWSGVGGWWWKSAHGVKQSIAEQVHGKDMVRRVVGFDLWLLSRGRPVLVGPHSLHLQEEPVTRHLPCEWLGLWLRQRQGDFLVKHGWDNALWHVVHGTQGSMVTGPLEGRCVSPLMTWPSSWGPVTPRRPVSTSTWLVMVAIVAAGVTSAGAARWRPIPLTGTEPIWDGAAGSGMLPVVAEPQPPSEGVMFRPVGCRCRRRMEVGDVVNVENDLVAEDVGKSSSCQVL
jgi:hypothetical protein